MCLYIEFLFISQLKNSEVNVILFIKVCKNRMNNNKIYFNSFPVPGMIKVSVPFWFGKIICLTDGCIIQDIALAFWNGKPNIVERKLTNNEYSRILKERWHRLSQTFGLIHLCILWCCVILTMIDSLSMDAIIMA